MLEGIGFSASSPLPGQSTGCQVRQEIFGGPIVSGSHRRPASHLSHAMGIRRGAVPLRRGFPEKLNANLKSAPMAGTRIERAQLAPVRNRERVSRADPASPRTMANAKAAIVDQELLQDFPKQRAGRGVMPISMATARPAQARVLDDSRCAFRFPGWGLSRKPREASSEAEAALRPAPEPEDRRR